MARYLFTVALSHPLGNGCFVLPCNEKPRPLGYARYPSGIPGKMKDNFRIYKRY